eukprot:TRINITY_DN1672_c1_g1_i1.p1 TRINITY_DN1672_c1_g1~~TRINITY_DN1672_c1_g1_i1.p1  ORF type:complete len:1125 (+),score=211.21 TRINITY_DN1672_c1_g1_i1:27-3401(+)
MDMSNIVPNPNARLGYRSGRNFVFEEEDTETNISYGLPDKTNRPTIKSATLDKLIVKLAYKETDPNLLFEFLLTYRSFCTPLELMDGLIQRLEKNEDDPVIPLRVFNVFRTWMDKHWYDFSKDRVVIDTTKEFFDYVKSKPKFAKAVEKIIITLQKKTVEKRDEPGTRKYNFSQKTPRPILPQNVGPGGLSLMDISALEMARQMTLIEFDMWTKIQHWECLKQAWTKSDKEEKAPNICAMISRFNVVSKWVATEICSVENPKTRLKVVSRFIEIAQKLRELNNFNGVLEIISGLNNSACYRLKSTFDALTKNQNQVLEELRLVVNVHKNYDKLRTDLHGCSPPCIPYLGMYLTDLIFIEDGHKDKTPTGHVNFLKRKQQAGVIREIQQYQQSPYCLDTVVFIKEYLLNLRFYDDDTLYRLSCYIDPKEGTTRPDKPPELMTKEERKRLKKAKQAEEEGMEFDLEFVQGYRFYVKDHSSNIITYELNSQTVISAATLEKLIERLTYDKHSIDSEFMNTFLSTYRSFCTPQLLLDLLIMRYNIPEPKDKSPATLEKFERFKLKPIRLRVFNTIKVWLEKYWYDFDMDPDLLKTLKDFIENTLSVKDKVYASALQRVLSKPTSTMTEEPPTPHLPSPTVSANNASIIDFHAEEVARQLCLLHFEILSKIPPNDFVDKNSSFVAKLEQAVKQLEILVLTDIGNLGSEKNQLASVLAKYILVAQHCYELNNFSATKGIISALEKTSIKELKDVWELVPVSEKKFFLDLKTLVNHSSKSEEFKAKMKEASPLCIPYLTLFLEDMLKIDEQVTSFIDGSQLINFEKYSRLSVYLMKLQTVQRKPYVFHEVPIIHAWLMAERDPSVKPPALAANVQSFGTARPSLPSTLSSPVLNVNSLASPKMPVVRPSSAVYPKVSTVKNDYPPSPSVKRSTVDNVSLPPTKNPGNVSEEAARRGSITGSAPSYMTKAKLLEMIREDNEFRSGIRIFIADVISQEFRKLKEEIVKVVNSRDQTNSSGSANGIVPINVQGIIDKEFPGCKLEKWNHHDQRGIVYGFAENIQIDILKKNDDSYLFDIKETIRASDVALLIRIGKLYKMCHPSGALACVIITRNIDPQASNMAAKSKIKVIVA